MVTLSLKQSQPKRNDPRANHFLYQPFDMQRYSESLAGIERIRNSTCLLFSCIRDVDSETFTRNTQRIRDLADCFKDSTVWLFENDSSKGFVELSKERAKALNFNIMNAKYGLQPIGSGRSDERIANYCFFRNQLFNIYKKYVKKDYDYIIIVDMDLKAWRNDGIFHSFGVKKEWDMIGANGIQILDDREVYYDSFAYVGKHWDIIPPGVDIPVFRFNDSIVPVKSCFGGIGIYKSKALLAGKKYVPKTINGISLCEHACIHMDMRAAGYTRFYINPNLIVVR